MSLFSTAGLNAIEEAIAGGFLEVEYDGKQIRYRSLSELLQIRDMIRRKLGLSEGAGGRMTFKYSRHGANLEGSE